MKKLLVLLAIIMIFPLAAAAGDLYRVEVVNADEAARLRAAGVEAVASVQNGYLVLADAEAAQRLAESGLTYTVVASGVQKNEMAFDLRLDRQNVGLYPLLYERLGGTSRPQRCRRRTPEGRAVRSVLRPTLEERDGASWAPV